MSTAERKGEELAEFDSPVTGVCGSQSAGCFAESSLCEGRTGNALRRAPRNAAADPEG